MKKIGIYICSFIMIIILTGCVSLEFELEDTSSTIESNKKEYSILIRDDEYVKMTLVSIDEEYNEICFDVENKTNQTISPAVELIEIDGKTESPAFIQSILANTTGQHCTYVSSVKNLTHLTAEIIIWDDDGSGIEKFKIKELELKKDWN